MLRIAEKYVMEEEDATNIVIKMAKLGLLSKLGITGLAVLGSLAGGCKPREATPTNPVKTTEQARKELNKLNKGPRKNASFEKYKDCNQSGVMTEEEWAKINKARTEYSNLLEKKDILSIDTHFNYWKFMTGDEQKSVLDRRRKLENAVNNQPKDSTTPIDYNQFRDVMTSKEIAIVYGENLAKDATPSNGLRFIPKLVVPEEVKMVYPWHVMPYFGMRFPTNPKQEAEEDTNVVGVEIGSKIGGSRWSWYAAGEWIPGTKQEEEDSFSHLEIESQGGRLRGGLGYRLGRDGGRARITLRAGGLIDAAKTEVSGNVGSNKVNDSNVDAVYGGEIGVKFEYDFSPRWGIAAEVDYEHNLGILNPADNETLDNPGSVTGRVGLIYKF